MSTRTKQDAKNPVTPTRRVAAPRVFDGAWADAHEIARTHLEPVFVPVTPYVDDRGWSFMNLLAGAMSDQGQINYSVQNPGVVKAWHRHDKQTDFWTCVSGHLKVGVYRESDDVAWMHVMGEKKPGVLIIPPPLWHGAACIGTTPAGLLYYVSNLFNPEAPDEHRRPWDSVEGFPWEVKNH